MSFEDMSLVTKDLGKERGKACTNHRLEYMQQTWFKSTATETPTLSKRPAMRLLRTWHDLNKNRDNGNKG